MSENQRRPGGGLSVPGPFPQGQRKNGPSGPCAGSCSGAALPPPSILKKRKAALWAAEQKRKDTLKRVFPSVLYVRYRCHRTPA